MIDLPLQAIPNQSFSEQIGDTRFGITIKETNGVMSITVVRDDVELVSMQRLTPGTPILPYLYLEDGNLLVLVEDEELPCWPAFGITQFLVYLSAEELAAARGD